MYDRSEIERKERVARLAQENLLKAAMPPRMEKYEKEKKQQELRKKFPGEKEEGKHEENKKTFHANEVPDFEKAHRQLREHLERKKKNFQPTEPKPFEFQELVHSNKNKTNADHFDIGNEDNRAGKDDNKKDPLEIARRALGTKPKIYPQTTKKTIALSEQRKQEREEKRLQEEHAEKEEEERKARYQKVY